MCKYQSSLTDIRTKKVFSWFVCCLLVFEKCRSRGASLHIAPM